MWQGTLGNDRGRCQQAVTLAGDVARRERNRTLVGCIRHWVGGRRQRLFEGLFDGLFDDGADDDDGALGLPKSAGKVPGTRYPATTI